MADLHRLPLRGHDLPLAADLRQQVRAKARVRKLYGSWSWSHDCGSVTTTAGLIRDYSTAVSWAVAHVKRCCS